MTWRTSRMKQDDKAMEVTLLEPIQSVFPITQFTPLPLLDLSNCYQIIYMLPLHYQRVFPRCPQNKCMFCSRLTRLILKT
ncbi:uncharacterized protein LOC105207170 isoform X1 [Solenopsis invicta]|uniref:uncharacterized protein LOC105207170 isoform X1 n=1 Tax=Solenopsis invicta TaxID=13686 RepID=UPI00193E0729|nr:uncharacterized protein LOC105207170 isoform X1 [Solenopsis invicta]